LLKVDSEKAILLHCDQEVTELLKKRIRGISLVDCHGLEQSSIRTILSNETVRSDSRSDSEETDCCFVIFNGIDSGHINQAISYIKSLSQRRWIFATTTPSNLDWSLDELLRELMCEHNYFNARRDSNER